MKLLKIEATPQSIILYADADGEVWLRESVPVANGRTLSMQKLTFCGGKAAIDRFAHNGDSLFSEFTAFEGSNECEGVKFVTELTGVAENTAPYPRPDIIKTIAAPKGMAARLRLRQSLLNINLPCIMTTQPAADDIPFEHNGRTYYFRRAEIDKVDAAMQAVPMTTMILLNSPRLFGSHKEKPLLDACLHPGYDWNCDCAYISAFDMETEEGQGYFGAFVEFLAARYTRTDKKYGLAVGAIISNEVDSQYVWGNAGEMTPQKYMGEYTQALRTAWLCGQKHAEFFRVYISLDQYWYGTCHNPTQPLRYYSGRTLLEELEANCKRDGDFPWAVAYHPYPEDLRWPDFWHDRAPDFTFTTPKITFKNMEVLEAFLSQPAFLYRGQPRRIIFSEQGFNSHSGALQGLTEQMAAAGYVLAYLKVRNMKTVDLFTHHACVDNPHEFGLNLGMFRYDPAAPEHIGEPKPIFSSFLAMDTENEPEVIASARAFIGAELFDYLLDPPIEYGDRDSSKDNEFG